MKICRRATQLAIAIAALAWGSIAHAQLPGVLYTWNGTGNIQQWKQNFGSNLGLLDNLTAGQLTIIETGPVSAEMSISDDANRRLESSTAGGGLDLTGLDFLEFDLGHSGPNPVNVQFYVQASTGFNFVALGPDVPVLPGMNTYSLSLAGLNYAQQAYIRTVGFTVRAHATDPPLVWALQEVRSAGTPLTIRDLATHDLGSSDGGKQGAFVNFDNAAVLGNDGGQNQTGLSQNVSGSGSLQWTDKGGGNGAAIAWGNGTTYSGNTFNERLTSLNGYQTVTYRMSAADVAGGSQSGAIDVQAYFQTGSGFSYQSPGTLSLPVDGAFHDLTFDISSITDLQNVQFSGVNLGSHANDVVINVDLIRYAAIPEPTALALAGLGVVAGLAVRKRSR
ncbi:MAG: PEP-CTERM sorting domain-containing protein [Planctomycetaceae bacterium]|nr:PEP-CTERM sorting domain-containing protein [Planctomycetaceae bacterium]